MSGKRDKNVFNDSWIQDKRFKSWLAAVPSKRDSGRCKLCNKDFKIDNGGTSNLLSHSKPKKHVELEKSASSYSTLFFKKKPPDPKPTDEKSVNEKETSSNNSSSLDHLKVPLSSTTAEIRWALKIVMDQSPFRSCLNLKGMFLSIFGDIDIVTNFALSKIKVAYLINHGLAPYFKSQLVECIK